VIRRRIGAAIDALCGDPRPAGCKPVKGRRASCERGQATTASCTASMTASSKWSSSILTTAATSTAETAALRSILRPRRSRPIQRPACRGSYIATIQGQGSATSYSPGGILILSPSWRPGALAGRAAGGACIELVPPKGPPIHKGPHWRGRRGDSVAVQHVHRRLSATEKAQIGNLLAIRSKRATALAPRATAAPPTHFTRPAGRGKRSDRIKMTGTPERSRRVCSGQQLLDAQQRIQDGHLQNNLAVLLPVATQH
jgi:hypothetical protein